MAILDERTEFADAVSVAAAAGTALIGDVIDLELIGLDLGDSAQDIWLVITTDTEIITAGAAGTLKFQLASDAQAAIATDGSATVHWDSGTIVTDDAAANDNRFNVGGVIAKIRLPAGTYERYLGILAITATTTTTAGKINAFLTTDYGQIKHYADVNQG